MFFARALLVSASIAGLVVPAILASPTANPVELAARGDPATVIVNAKVVINDAQNLINKVAALKTANAAAAAPVEKHVRSLLDGVVFPQNGVLSGGTDALTDCLGGNTGSLGGLGGLLTSDGLKNLLNGLLGGLLGGLGLDPLLTSVGNLLNSLLDARGSCGCGDGLDNLLQQVIDAVNQLLGSLGPVASASNGCGICGTSSGVTKTLQPLLSGLFGNLSGL
ncbi:hypothetical protein C8R45DRAFT_1099464 [Mycena sanguinolenta]|nr:hypothetical protein C8R45DRAFT_1099464 [Mycena sanguinolenta]